MYVNYEEIVKAQQEAVKTGNAMFQTAFEGARKLADLNVRTARAGFEQSSEQFRSLASVSGKSPADAGARMRDAANLDSGLVSSYVEQAVGITTETARELQSLVDSQINANRAQIDANIEQFARNAPAGSEGMVKLLRQGVAQANAAFDQFNTAGKRIGEMVEANVVGATKAAAKARPAA